MKTIEYNFTLSFNSIISEDYYLFLKDLADKLLLEIDLLEDAKSIKVKTTHYKNALEFLNHENVLGDEEEGDREGNINIIIGEGVNEQFYAIKDYLASELKEELEEDILERYNNEEYWDLYEGEEGDEEEFRDEILDRYNNEEYWSEDIIEDYFIRKGILYNEEQKELILSSL